MKTVDEKALGIIREWKGEAYHDSYQAEAALQVAIIKAIKEQDRDTRYACAEAVVDLPASCQDGCVKRTEAVTACMNVRAV